MQFVHRLYNLLGFSRVQDGIHFALVIVEVAHERAPAECNFGALILLVSVPVAMAVATKLAMRMTVGVTVTRLLFLKL